MKKTRLLVMFGLSALAATVLLFSNASVATATPGKSVICHNDVDDEEAYDSIAIEVSNSSVSKHFSNHGDGYTSDPVGTENCSVL